MRFAGTLSMIPGLLVAGPAIACTVVTPYWPLRAIPPKATGTLLVDVGGITTRNGLPIATLKVVRTYRGTIKAGTTVALGYGWSVCGQSREPAKGQRLIVYAAADRAEGWATIDEAKRFDPAVR